MLATCSLFFLNTLLAKLLCNLKFGVYNIHAQWCEDALKEELNYVRCTEETIHR